MSLNELSKSFVTGASRPTSVVFLLLAWKVLIGMTWELDDNRMFYWLGTTIFLLILLQPILMRLSRSIWLGWFVSFNKNWKNEPLEYNERMDEHMKEM